ncbi:MAG: MogA/MoaB family molybdenum cofactor biosynthesis protein [Planctomycetota bacterium]|jgi:molybdenum cofactor synthesis domain-containing protein
MSKQKTYPAAVITVSDKSASGKREDKSGPALKKVLNMNGFDVIRYKVVPDELNAIVDSLHGAAEVCRLIVTTGGTGVSPRDMTPEATRQVINKEIPGYGELMRAVSYGHTKTAIISRALAGSVGKTLIVNVPGNDRAAVECIEAVMPAIPHTLKLLAGKVRDCAEEDLG